MESYVWYLGDDYDCETCGWTYNEVVFEEDDGVWILRTSVGCYHGEHTMSTDKDFMNRAEEIIQGCLEYSGFDEDNAKDLRNAIAEKIGV